MSYLKRAERTLDTLKAARAARDYDRLLCEVSALSFEIVKAVAEGRRPNRTEAAQIVAYVKRNDPRPSPTPMLSDGNGQA